MPNSTNLICWVYVNQSYSKFRVNFDKNDQFILSNQISAVGYIETLKEEIIIELKDNQLYLNDKIVSFNKKYEIAKHKLILTENQEDYLISKSSLGNTNYVNFNSKDESFAKIKDLYNSEVFIYQSNDELYLDYDGNSSVYVNHQLVSGKTQIKLGDVMYFHPIELAVKDNGLLQISNFGASGDFILNDVESSNYEPERFSDDYPDYHRSPRIIKKLPEGTITIENPPSKPEKIKNQLAKTILPPMMMVGVSIVTSLISKNFTTMIMMGAMSVTTISFSVNSFFSDKKKNAKDEQDRIDNYDDYLQEKIVSINKKSEQTKDSLNYHYPNLNEISEMILEGNSRIYEKNKFQFDFLSFRLGIGDIEAPYKVSYKPKDFEKDELSEKASSIAESSTYVHNIPVTTSILKGTTGLVGQRLLVKDSIQNMIVQLATFHSYHELNFISVFDEKNLSD